MEENVVRNEIVNEVTEVATTEVIRNYDWKDYTMTGLAGVGAAAILAAAGFGIFKGVKFITKKVKEAKSIEDDFDDFDDEFIPEEE